MSPAEIDLKSLDQVIDSPTNSQLGKKTPEPDFHNVNQNPDLNQSNQEGVVSDNVSTNDQTNVDTKKMNPLLAEKIKACLGEFYKMMNDKAADHGMKKSNFAVAHGMHNDNNYSTALDMAKISC